ncbi:hypothetical protein HDU93_008245 [Gonapodya sp. JEL0774]|nr:hypothetical protein HDU93_008245 [Gonapodya sp. JEL0774]
MVVQQPPRERLSYDTPPLAFTRGDEIKFWPQCPTTFFTVTDLSNPVCPPLYPRTQSPAPLSHNPFNRGRSSCSDMSSDLPLQSRRRDVAAGPPPWQARPDSELDVTLGMEFGYDPGMPPLVLARENSDGTETVYPFAYFDRPSNHMHVDLGYDAASSWRHGSDDDDEDQDDEDEEIFEEHTSHPDGDDDDDRDLPNSEMAYLYPPDAESGIYSGDVSGIHGGFDLPYRLFYSDNPYNAYLARDPLFFQDSQGAVGEAGSDDTSDEEPPGLILDLNSDGDTDEPVGELGLYHSSLAPRSDIQVHGIGIGRQHGFRGLLASLEAEAERMARREVELVAEIREEERRLEELMRQVVEGLEGRVRDAANDASVEEP